MSHIIQFWNHLVRQVNRLAHRRGDRFNALRRHAEMLLDQSCVRICHRLTPAREIVPFDGQARIALITVNFSTTHYLKLMLLTLAGQSELKQVTDIVVVDNDSRDGGREFLRKLAKQVPRLVVVENNRFPTHARGMRIGIEAIRKAECSRPETERSNVYLFCDTDIVFRKTDTLLAVAEKFSDPGVGFVGELRRDLYPYPEAQASFIAVRRDCYEHPGVIPMVHHGAPAYFMQRSLHQLGVKLADFPSNHGGYILHRGRAGVAATRTFRPGDAHATAAIYHPHYMGIPGGQLIWEEIEKKWSDLLDAHAEDRLLEHLAKSLA